MFLIDIFIYIYIKGIFPFSPFKPLATVSNPISSDQNNSLVIALPRVPAVNTIDRRIIYQSTLVPTRVANPTCRHFFSIVGRLQSLSTYKGKWANSQPPTDGVRFNVVILEKPNHTLHPHCYLLPKILIFEFLLTGWLGYQSLA